MPRPRKWRHVCCMPACAQFGPVGAAAAECVVMTVDEYETIRVIDLEGASQEQCAVRMGIARTTVQGIYIAARRKLAEVLVYGRTLRIEGGDYKLCEGTMQTGCRCSDSRWICPRQASLAVKAATGSSADAGQNPEGGTIEK